jgi:hypothetical protein
VARKRKPPPLAFSSVTMMAVASVASASNPAFAWDFSGALYHPESNTFLSWGGTTGIAPTLSAKAARTAIIKQLQRWAQTRLLSQGHDVPADRIGVIPI